MEHIFVPKGYRSPQTIKETEVAIKEVKDYFERALADALNLTRVSAPLFVWPSSGLNDNLNGVERPVTFGIKEYNDAEVEVVHSLAKWKRLTLAEYEIEPGYGIYTDMNAIRADEELDNLHSLYVDQWDWEASIRKEDRTLAFLKNIVERIYAAIRRTEYLVCESYPQIKPFLPEKIHFVHAEEFSKYRPLESSVSADEKKMTEVYNKYLEDV